MTRQNKVTAMASKAQVLEALRKHINQRSGIDYRNYGDRESYLGDYRPMLQAGKDARVMLRWVELRESIKVADILEGTRAYSGRLKYNEDRDRFEYVTGQYFPTEYRAAACAMLAAVIAQYACECGYTAIKGWARKEFGRGIADRWF